MGSAVNLGTTNVHFREGEYTLPVPFTVDLPPTVRPGKSTAEIWVEEVLEKDAQGGAVLKILLRHKIIIHGAYPDKYVEAKLNFHEQGMK
jgi:hypothetical protein